MIAGRGSVTLAEQQAQLVGHHELLLQDWCSSKTGKTV